MWTQSPKQETKSTASFSSPTSSKVLHTTSVLTPTVMQLQKTFDNRVITQFLNQQKQASDAFNHSQNTIQMKANETGLPDQLKSGLENLSGVDLSDVKVHYNSLRPEKIGALAYAQGNDIHLGPGQEKHLPHEGWHVVQQKQGRVKPTLQMKGAAINDNVELEKEADVMGRKATEFLSTIQFQQNDKYNLSETNNVNTESIQAWKKQHSTSQFQNQPSIIQKMDRGEPVERKEPVDWRYSEGRGDSEENDNLEDLDSILERIENFRQKIRSFLVETNDYSHINLIKYLEQLEDSFCDLDENDNETKLLLLETLEGLQEQFTERKKKGITTSEREEDIQLPTTFPKELQKEYKLSGNSHYFNPQMYKTITECAININRAKGELLRNNDDDMSVWEDYNKIVEIVHECAKLETEEQIKTYWTMLRIGLVAEILDMKNKALSGVICNEDMANSILNALKQIKK